MEVLGVTAFSVEISAGEVKLGIMTQDFALSHQRFRSLSLDAPSKFSAYATEWGPAKCFQSGTALAKAGPAVKGKNLN